ncbi:Protein kinase C-binding protein NELL2 [Stylophora pistillata]|uniref:Protein kinase C-binding protein NELL2 n=1 Tax=Stylophora pistillata TaxID=50429 RepID=A0A2B4RHK3_STYPI|nr:Protein kinase C-binding protein NELL2 [Stylophora pistillata]
MGKSRPSQCRNLEFSPERAFEGKRLMNHTIRIVEVTVARFCENVCYMEPDCVSINLDKRANGSGGYKCELNNVTHEGHEHHLTDHKDFFYHAAESYCVKNPCKNNARCQSGFTDEGYRCLCMAGFSGPRSIELLMARNGNLTSDLREAISKINEVGRLLAPLTSNPFEELSTSSHEVPHVNRPTVNSEVSDPQSIAPSGNVNHELQRLFPTLKRLNEQASPSSFRPAEHLTLRGGKKRKRQTPKANANCKKGKPVFRDIVLIPNPKHNRVPTHSAQLQLERKDTDECVTGLHNCSPNAYCNNTNGSYNCTCKPGFTGNGQECKRVTSCNEIYNNIKGANMSIVVTLFVDSQPVPVLCHMGDFGCGNGGWTPVMKIDGRNITFHYNKRYWSDYNEFNPTGGQTGFDEQETKLPTYWNTSFSKICLGMKIDQQLKFIVIDKHADSLFALIADGKYRSTSLGRDMWISLIGSDASLQQNCNKEGFNADFSWRKGGAKARIGIVGNNRNNCSAYTSRIGFGTGGWPYYSISCGNTASSSRGNGKKGIKAMGYILVH